MNTAVPARRVIAYVTSFFPPQRMAGAELGTYFMARHMTKLGYDVHVIITRSADNKVKTEIRDGFTIHWLAHLNIPGLRFFSECAAAMRVIRDIEPHLVQGNCLLPGGWVAAQCSRALGIPSVVLCYGYDVCDMKFPLSWWGARAFKHCSQLLASTNYCRAVMATKSRRQVDGVFYAGVDEQVFPLQALRTGAGPFKLLHVGRMIPEKGFELLLQVMRLLPHHYQLDVLGDGPLRATYEHMVQCDQLAGRVHFHGVVPNERLHEFHNQADALLLPSLREPFGVVCLEAICSGLPVVCSAVMGLPEAVLDGRNGMVVAERDPHKWCAAVRRACEDGGFRRVVHEAARVDRIKWSWTERFRELEGRYATLLAQGC